MEIVFLSQYFNENTYLIAGKCSRCYQENRNVQIVGANGVFLKNYKKFVKSNSQVWERFDFGKEFFVYLDEDLKPRKKLSDHNFNDVKTEIKFVPPKSPYNLIEEELYHDPWKLLVATIFLNRTSLKFSKDHIEWFLNSFDTPEKLLQTDISKLEKYFEPLGLQKTRAVQVYYMTHDYMFKKWKKVEEIYGIGDYGRDAYNMFCLGNFGVEPKDRYLRIYKNWYQKVYLQEEEKFAKEFYKASSQKENSDPI